MNLFFVLLHAGLLGFLWSQSEAIRFAYREYGLYAERFRCENLLVDAQLLLIHRLSQVDAAGVIAQVSDMQLPGVECQAQISPCETVLSVVLSVCPKRSSIVPLQQETVTLKFRRFAVDSRDPSGYSSNRWYPSASGDPRIDVLT